MPLTLPEVALSWGFVLGDSVVISEQLFVVLQFATVLVVSFAFDNVSRALFLRDQWNLSLIFENIVDHGSQSSVSLWFLLEKTI